MAVIQLSIGKNTFSALTLEPSSHYTCVCPKNYFVAIDTTAYVAATDDYAEFWGGTNYTLVTTGNEYQLAIIGGTDAPTTALPLDDPGALLVTLEKFTPTPPVY